MREGLFFINCGSWIGEFALLGYVLAIWIPELVKCGRRGVSTH